MSNTTTRGGPRAMTKRKKGLLASLLSFFLVATMAQSAFAGIGTGGVEGGPGSGSNSGQYVSVINYDNYAKAQADSPVQGWGDASIDYFVNLWLDSVRAQGYTALDSNWKDGSKPSRESVNLACRQAIDRAIERDPKSNKARVVSLAFSWGTKISPSGTAIVSAQEKKLYRQKVADFWNENGFVGGYNAPERDFIKRHHFAQIDAFGASIRTTCVALNENEPPPPPPSDYTLTVTTDKGNPFNLSGGTDPVHDVIHAKSSDPSIKENLKAKVILHWDQAPSTNTSTKHVVKEVTITNNGDTTSPNFTPSDFGWKVWPSGQFWFDVQVPKQGKMKAGVDTPDRDPRETWKALYNLDITTDHSGGFELAGSTNAVSDVIHANSNGAMRPGTVNASVILHWDGFEPGTAKSVTKKVDIKLDGDTRSPDFAPSDFGWKAWPAGIFWFDVQIDKQGLMAKAVDTPDRDPRETWEATPPPPRKQLRAPDGTVIGENGELASGMYYEGRISALSAGYKSMAITDTITIDEVFVGSANADNSDAVFILDPSGNKVSNATIDINRSGGKVIVTGTVPSIPDEFQGSEYTLVVPTYVLPTGADYEIPDDSRVCHAPGMDGVENCLDGNSEGTHKVTPNPDKVWVLDEDGALKAEDPDHTNQVDRDQYTFAPGSPIGAVVNGHIPANLIDNLDSYKIVDDWSDAAKYIDFSNAALTKVYRDGKDVTDQFTITVDGSVTTAVAKDSFLSTTKGLSKDSKIKLYIGGVFKNDYSTNGELREMINAGFEMWNNEKQETNTPPVFTITPKPDKVWVLDEDGALKAEDPDHTNQVDRDQYTFAPGSPIGAVVNGHIPANLGVALENYVITDDWSDAAKYIDFTDVSKVKVYRDGVDVTNQFDITITDGVTTATAKAGSDFLKTTAELKVDSQIKLYIGGVFKNDYSTDGELEKMINSGSETWNNRTEKTNVPPVFTITPKPDKVWVLDEDGALSTADPDWTNNKGADNKVFLMNDVVYAVVNGKIPANLGVALDNYAIIDDWSDGLQYVDFNDKSLVKVYRDGVDVTDQFDITIADGVTTATAKAGSDFLTTSAELANDVPVKLIIGGVFRDDYDTDGETVKLVNKGFETWNNRTEPTNVPPVYTWTPDPDKDVIGSAEESGDKTYESINGLSVWPGQKLEYSIGVDLRVPSNTARGVKTLAVEDVYDPYFIPDKSSIEFWDSRGDKGRPTVVPASNYKVTFNEDNHSFRVDFTEEWIDKNVNKEDGSANSEWLTKGWLTMRFAGTVSPEIAGGSSVVNQAFQIINGAKTATEIPEVEVPPTTTDKEDLNTDLVDIDGKTVVKGDIILYRLTMDATPARDQLAYDVHKLGMVDDFDDEYLSLDESGIHVSEIDTGKDVTDKFNIQVLDGVAYIFAKQVDSVNFHGEEIKGDPQPENLAEYASAKIVPGTTPIIDQDLMGKKYYITLATKVIKELDGYVIENGAEQWIENTSLQTKIVSNPLKEIDPEKDVVISEETKDESINENEVPLHSTFNYKLDSSVIPANRAYGASQWSISDTFDRVHDYYTGIWAAYANEDIYNGDELIYAKGDLLQDSAGHESEVGSGLFTVSFNEETYTFHIEATEKFLDLVNTRGDLPAAFSVYTKMERIAPSERVENTATESYNEVERNTEIVWTHTPEHPSVGVIKYTLDEDVDKGDRNTEGDAYPVPVEDLEIVDDQQVGTKVGFTITNDGDVDLEDVVITDETHTGTGGHLEDLVCQVPAEGVDVLDEVIVEDEETTGAVGDTVAESAKETDTDDDKETDNDQVNDGEGEGEGEGEPTDTDTDTEADTDVDGDEQAPEVEMTWVDASSITTLSVGQTVECYGTLRGMEPGMLHANTIKVTGKSIYSDKTVEDDDPWFARIPSDPQIDIEKYTWEEGLETGDRDTFDEALELSAEQVENGVRIAFEITNTGDEPLGELVFTDTTIDSTTGKVEDIKWYQEVDEDAKQMALDTYEQSKTVADEEKAKADSDEATDDPAADEVEETTDASVDEEGESASEIADQADDSDADVDSETEGEGEDASKLEMDLDVTEPVFEKIGETEYRVRDISELGVLNPGESVLLLGTLTGVTPGTAHGDIATITGNGVHSGKEVNGDDPWFAKSVTPQTPDPECPKCDNPTPDPDNPGKGVVTGEEFSNSNTTFIALGVLLLMAALATGVIARKRLSEARVASEVAEDTTE